MCVKEICIRIRQVLPQLSAIVLNFCMLMLLDL